MDTRALPDRMNKLRKDINALILEFNNDVGLSVSEVHAQPLAAQKPDGSSNPIVYDIAIGMDF